MTKCILTFIVFTGLFLPGPFLRTKTPSSGGPQRVEVVAKRFSFEPQSITLKKGEPVILELRSGDVPHGLRFRELNVEVKAPKGGSGKVQFTPETVGDFVGHCSVFCGVGHGAMTLTLHVIG
jgi:cytochrome c oxidase subunit II